MNDISNEQLDDIRKQINDRIAEFESSSISMSPLSRGVVRVAFEVIAPFVRGQMTPCRDDAEERTPLAYSNGHGEKPPLREQAENKEFYQELEKRRTERELADTMNRHNGVPGWRPGEEFGELLPDKVATTLGPEHVVVTPLKDKPPAPDVAHTNVAYALANGSGDALVQAMKKPRAMADEGRRFIQPSLEELIAEVQRQSMGGMMPSVNSFDAARPAKWAGAQAQILRHGIAWNELAIQAGLRPRPRGGQGKE